MKRILIIIAAICLVGIMASCSKEGSGEKKYTVTIQKLVKGLKIHECDDSGATINLLKPDISTGEYFEFTADENATKVKIEVSCQWMDKPSEGTKYRWYKVVTPLKAGKTVNIVVDVNDNQTTEP